jgi:uracil-DNA glycosylase
MEMIGTLANAAEAGHDGGDGSGAVTLFARALRRPRPAPVTLDGLRHDIQRCRSCPLHAAATQAVFGEGPPSARLMLVGEQPDHHDDLAGRPLDGAAGQMLDRALTAAGIARGQVYVTHAVKHFKFAQRGRRRVDQRPERQEIAACRSWLNHEIALVKPSLIVALGAAAGRALLGRNVAAAGGRGQLFSGPFCVPVTVTLHPSHIPGIADPERRAGEYDRLVADLRAAQARIDETACAAGRPLLAATG